MDYTNGLGHGLARLLLQLPLLYTIIAATGVYCFADGDPEEPNAPAGAEDDQTVEDTEDQDIIYIAEAVEKEQKAMKYIAALEAKKLELLSQVKALREAVQEMGNLLIKEDLENDKLLTECEREREAQNVLQAENDKLKNTLIENRELLQVSMAEAEKKHQNAMESIAQLESENSNLAYQVKTLQATVQEMGSLLSEANIDNGKLLNECDEARELQNLLQVENDMLKKALIDKEELLKEFELERVAEKDEMKTLENNGELQKVCLMESKEKNKKAVEFIAQLGAKKSHLTNQLQTLQETMQDLCSLICNANIDDLLTKDCKRKQKPHSKLQDSFQDLQKGNETDSE
ncbi:hypothetical protein C0J50_20056 [Silurus asotus]|uniref:Uncharacterized protein n=1 Tax=Silurus asotus TaxID=30991 RepID=A0AAD5ARS4_SILAS|nr:hypothetical protein C0J50_20056 [Silurus asotus]